MPLFSPQDEPGLYLNDQGKGYFSILTRDAEGNRHQESFEVAHLPFVVDSYANKPIKADTWISQGTFYRKNRRIVNLKSLSLLFLDIDCYKCNWAKGLTPEQMAMQFEQFCVANGIPKPSVIVFSGRGLQPKWILKKALPAAALPRWNAVQRQLVKVLHSFGADPLARDASRVLRLVQTVNLKSKEVCRIVHQNDGEDGRPISYAFDEFADLVLPFTRARIHEMAQERLENNAWKNADRTSECGILTLETLNWARLQDLLKLAEIRGGIEEGHRMIMLMYLMNFLALSHQVSTKTFFMEARQLVPRIDPRWDYYDQELSTVFQKLSL